MNRRLIVALAAVFAVASFAVAKPHHANALSFHSVTSSFEPVPLCNPDDKTCGIKGPKGK